MISQIVRSDVSRFLNHIFFDEKAPQGDKRSI